MKLIVISAPFPVPEEVSVVNRLFEAGLQYYHIRSPFVDSDTQRKFIWQIGEDYRRRLVIHQHFEIAESLPIWGIHFKENNVKLLAQGDPAYLYWVNHKIANPNFHLSASFHDLEVIQKAKEPYDYVFISPVFESISKEGYTGSFNLSSIQKTAYLTKQKIIVMGGVEPENIPIVHELGVDGVAVLGYIWKSPDPVQAYLNLQEKCIKPSPSSLL